MLSAFCCCSIRKFFIDITDNQKFGISVPQVRKLFRIAIDGWRHFQVVNRKNQGQWVFAEIVAACDPNVRFWLNAKLLKDPSQWQAGWQSLQEMEDLEGDAS